MKVKELFKIHTARSRGFEKYGPGETKFVSNGFMNNGVVGFVDPFDDDRVFNLCGISVSSFCEATVQKPPFLPRGNGGSGLIVLEPKGGMDDQELLYYSSYINNCFRWRFSFGRMVTKRRFAELEIIPYGKKTKRRRVADILPKNTIEKVKIKNNRNFAIFNIEELFTLHRGDFHALSKLDRGDFPTVSRAGFNNGVVGYYERPENAEVYSKYVITVSTVTGDAFVQLHEFICTDNVVICKPKFDFRITTLFFIQFMLNSVKWRWSYGRQCYKTKFATTKIHLPVVGDRNIDENYIKKLLSNTPYWNQIDRYIEENK